MRALASGWALGLCALWACRADAPAADAGAADGRVAPAGELRLMTWNLEVFPRTAATAERVALVLDEVAPDLVAIQEIADPAAFVALADGLPGWAGVQVDDPDGFQRVGLLYREARVTVDEVEALFAGDGYAFPRPVLKVRARTAAVDLVLLVVHLKAQLDDASQERRRVACARLDEWLRAELAAGGELDYAIAGDFNDEVTDAGADNVFGPLLDEATYRVLTGPAAEAGGATYIPFASFIDHVIITRDLVDEYGPGGTTEVLAPDARMGDYLDVVSDHRPVLVRFGAGA